MKTKMMAGSIAYMVGLFGAIILGILSAAGVFEFGSAFATILILAGIVIGLFNVTRKETVPIMVASILLGAGAGALALLDFIGIYFERILGALALVAVPAGIVVAFTVFWKRGK